MLAPAAAAASTRRTKFREWFRAKEAKRFKGGSGRLDGVSHHLMFDALPDMEDGVWGIVSREGGEGGEGF